MIEKGMGRVKQLGRVKRKRRGKYLVEIALREIKWWAKEQEKESLESVSKQGRWRLKEEEMACCSGSGKGKTVRRK